MNTHFEPPKREMLPFYEVSHRLLVIERENLFAALRSQLSRLNSNFSQGTREQLAEAIWKLNYPRSDD